MTRRASAAQLELPLPPPPASGTRAAPLRVELVEGKRHRRAPAGMILGGGLFAATTAAWAASGESERSVRERVRAWGTRRERVAMFRLRPLGGDHAREKALAAMVAPMARFACWDGCGTPLPERGACGMCRR